MLYGDLIHPDILRALASAGHGSTVLVADGNFPVSTATRPRVARVFLNLAPNIVTVDDVLGVLTRAVPIECVALMGPPEGDAAPHAHQAILRLLPAGTKTVLLDRHGFYETTRERTLALVIATADTRPFANALLTIGVRSDDPAG